MERNPKSVMRNKIRISQIINNTKTLTEEKKFNFQESLPETLINIIGCELPTYVY